MTRDTYQQFRYTGVVLITKLDHYFTSTVSVNPFCPFKMSLKCEYEQGEYKRDRTDWLYTLSRSLCL